MNISKKLDGADLVDSYDRALLPGNTWDWVLDGTVATQRLGTVNGLHFEIQITRPHMDAILVADRATIQDGQRLSGSFTVPTDLTDEHRRLLEKVPYQIKFSRTVGSVAVGYTWTARIRQS